MHLNFNMLSLAWHKKKYCKFLDKNKCAQKQKLDNNIIIIIIITEGWKHVRAVNNYASDQLYNNRVQ